MSSAKDPTRARILDAAQLLLEQGDAALVRMADIAKAAGVSRQTVYIHFPNRAELLIATTRHVDDMHKVDEKLQASRNAETGVERLDAWIEFWGNYVPAIYGVAKALLAMQQTDDEARAAWRDRMQAVREGCAAAVHALEVDGQLNSAFSADEATDLLWGLLSVRMWEHLRLDCGWSQHNYVSHVKEAAALILVKPQTTGR